MRKSVALITMHKVLNYGSVLQTLALYKYVVQLGYDVTIIDYDFPNEYHLKISEKSTPKMGDISWLRNHLNGLCNRFLKNNFSNKVKSFNDFITDNMILSDRYRSADELKNNPFVADIYITGSDQVWNHRYIGEDLTFALDWVRNEDARKISYASSFGAQKCQPLFGAKLLPYLKKYKYLSLREDNDLLINNNLSYQLTLDPTFLLDKNQWLKYTDKEPLVKGKYLLCYLIGYSYNPFPYVYELTKYIQKQTGLKVVMISGEPVNILRGYKLFNDAGPRDFLNLFYHASMVLTTSFHGTAFAINFNKPFLTVVDGASDNDNRQRNIVKFVGLDESHVVKCGTPLAKIKLPALMESYAPKLDLERHKSRTYIESSLK